MSTEMPLPAPGGPAVPQTSEATCEPLSVNERRVLGVLVEKAKTTPDNYPLTPNALITGCNQKSNRDPILALGDVEMEEALAGLKKRGMVQQILGSGRTDKIRHVLYDALNVNKVELAVLGELLLRGPQTEGELRGRAGRMEEIADLETLRSVLRGMVERKLVVYLTPEGRRGTAVTHGFHTTAELERLRHRHDRLPADDVETKPETETSQSHVRGPAWEQRLQALETAVAALQQAVQELRSQHGTA